MPFEGVYTGPITRADGTSGAHSRVGRSNELIIAHGKARYAEQTARANVFHLTLTAWTTTINAGNINGAAAAAVTQFALWNPANSGKVLSLLKFAVFPISGTAPVAGVFHSMSSTAPSIANALSAGSIQNGLIGNKNATVAGYVAHAAGTALTGSTALTIIRAADLYITAGTAANLAGGKCVEYIDGDILLLPGTCWVPTWVAAGTTFLGGYSVTYEELPLIGGQA